MHFLPDVYGSQAVPPRHRYNSGGRYRSSLQGEEYRPGSGHDGHAMVEFFRKISQDCPANLVTTKDVGQICDLGGSQPQLLLCVKPVGKEAIMKWASQVTRTGKVLLYLGWAETTGPAFWQDIAKLLRLCYHALWRWQYSPSLSSTIWCYQDSWPMVIDLDQKAVSVAEPRPARGHQKKRS